VLAKISVAFALVAALPALAAPARVTAHDYEDFESCFGSFEGASTVLPKLQDRIAANDFETIEHAMQNLGTDLNGIEMRLSHAIIRSDPATLAEAHRAGRLAWTQPQNQTLDYWSRNGPMSRFCFDLTKRLNEDLPLGF
jgi:hypothetical protein